MATRFMAIGEPEGGDPQGTLWSATYLHSNSFRITKLKLYLRDVCSSPSVSDLIVSTFQDEGTNISNLTLVGNSQDTEQALLFTTFINTLLKVITENRRLHLETFDCQNVLGCAPNEDVLEAFVAAKRRSLAILNLDRIGLCGRLLDPDYGFLNGWIQFSCSPFFFPRLIRCHAVGRTLAFSDHIDNDNSCDVTPLLDAMRMNNSIQTLTIYGCRLPKKTGNLALNEIVVQNSTCKRITLDSVVLDVGRPVLRAFGGLDEVALIDCFDPTGTIPTHATGTESPTICGVTLPRLRIDLEERGWSLLPNIIRAIPAKQITVDFPDGGNFSKTAFKLFCKALSNTPVETLVLNFFNTPPPDDSSLDCLMRVLADMKQLFMVEIYSSCKIINPAFASTLLRSVKRNPTLRYIDFPKKNFPQDGELGWYLELNRFRAREMLSAPPESVPDGLWPLILAKGSNPSVSYYFIQKKLFDSPKPK
eukprot:scaffold1294_cov167-Amphora_coffeaeformis.AAC.1